MTDGDNKGLLDDLSAKQREAAAGAAKDSADRAAKATAEAEQPAAKPAKKEPAAKA